jgi:hypothetical protein
VCGRGEVRAEFWWGTVRERDHFEDSRVDGRVILTWILLKWKGDMDWINLA